MGVYRVWEWGPEESGEVETIPTALWEPGANSVCLACGVNIVTKYTDGFQDPPDGNRDGVMWFLLLLHPSCFHLHLMPGGRTQSEPLRKPWDGPKAV